MITISDLRWWLDQTKEPLLSLYLVVDTSIPENQTTTPAWKSWLKTALRDAESELSEDQREEWQVVRLRLEALLSSYEPTGKTLVLFLGSHTSQLYELPVLLKNYLSFGEPALTPLLYAMNLHKPYLINLLYHDIAHLWVVALNHIEYQMEMKLELHDEDWSEFTLMPASSAGGYVKAGSHRDRYTHRVEEQVERFYKRIAQQISKLGKKHRLEYVVLAGNEEANHELQKLIPDQTVIGPISVAPYLSSSEVLKQILPAVAEYEHEQELALVEGMIDQMKSGGRCISDTKTVTAMEQHRVELLVVPWPSANEKLVDELVLEALKTGADVKPVGGLAAERLVDECGIVVRLHNNWKAY